MSATESARLRFGTAWIDYVITRSERRRKTVEITVDPVDGVRVAAPATATREKLEGLIRRRAPWILDRLRAQGETLAVSPREYVTGETFDYLGRQARLRVLNAEPGTRPSVRLFRGWFEVAVQAAGPTKDRRIRIIRALETWYRQHAEVQLRARVARYAERIGVQPSSVVVRAQEKRWGSCSRDSVLRFNWRIVMAPPSIVDYVVVHELCHLRYPDHSRRFWEAVAAVLPDYDLRRERLRREGSRYRL